MTEIEMIIDEVCAALEALGVGKVFPAYPSKKRERYARPVVTVALKSGSGVGAGLAEYLGVSYDEKSDAYAEVFGKRLELTLSLCIYSPRGDEFGAGECGAVFGRIVSSLPSLPSGLKAREIKCGETAFDETSGTFLLEAEMSVTAFLTAESYEEDEVLDFTLRGTVK